MTTELFVIEEEDHILRCAETYREAYRARREAYNAMQQATYYVDARRQEYKDAGFALSRAREAYLAAALVA